MSDPLSDQQRYPLHSVQSREFLRQLREHPNAPLFTGECGDRLDAEGVARVKAFDALVQQHPAAWRDGETPAWAQTIAAQCYADVPYWRDLGQIPYRFTDIPPISRAHLSQAIWRFVPDSVPLDNLIIYPTYGTTGHPVTVPSHPEVAAKYFALLKRALATHGVNVQPESNRVICALVCYQTNTVVVATIAHSLEGAGFIKVNLHPNQWRQPSDCVAYLNDLNPQIITGDPISFEALLTLPLNIHPRGLISSSMTLLPGLAQQLEDRYGCPVIDVYSTNETGPIAACRPAQNNERWALLQPQLYLEILDNDGLPCPSNQRGEITLTGGFNHMLPLLRYRTGDFAALSFDGAEPSLLGLQGRPPVVFRAMDGRPINNIDVTHALRKFTLSQFALHQDHAGQLHLRLRRAPQLDENAIRMTLQQIFGPDQPIHVEKTDDLGKVIQYTREP